MSWLVLLVLGSSSQFPGKSMLSPHRSRGCLTNIQRAPTSVGMLHDVSNSTSRDLLNLPSEKVTFFDSFDENSFMFYESALDTRLYRDLCWCQVICHLYLPCKLRYYWDRRKRAQGCWWCERVIQWWSRSERKTKNWDTGLRPKMLQSSLAHGQPWAASALHTASHCSELLITLTGIQKHRPTRVGFTFGEIIYRDHLRHLPSYPW